MNIVYFSSLLNEIVFMKAFDSKSKKKLKNVLVTIAKLHEKVGP